MNEINYNKARRYVAKIFPAYEKDFVHDAYIMWYNKTGKDLFNEHIYTILTVLRFRISHYRIKLSFTTKRDGRRPKRFLEAVPDYRTEEADIGKNFERGDQYVIKDPVNPEWLLTQQDLYTQFVESLTEEQKDLFYQLDAGFITLELAKLQHRSWNQIKAEAKELQKKLRTFLSEQY